jgi:hypothetical protein
MGGGLCSGTICELMDGPVPFVFSKALYRFVLEALNAFRDAFSYQGRIRQSL